jgi:hypothetical protein
MQATATRPAGTRTTTTVTRLLLLRGEIAFYRQDATSTTRTRSASPRAAYAALFLPDSDPDFADKLVAEAADGVRVRILAGDPEADAVLRRGLEEGINGGMAERVRIALSYLAPAIGSPGVEGAFAWSSQR